MVPEQLRRLSSAVFGNRYRFELLAALVAAGDGGVCVTTLAASGGAASSVYYPPLKQLVDAGLVRRLDPPPGERRVHYVVTDNAAWTGLRQMMQDLGVQAIRRDQVRAAAR
jgi:DNA-binding MarR family transcriptional regulator